MPWLPEVVDTIENCSKPVVAAIHGTALGGGLEVALGCHYRVAVPTAKLGTPEVKLGLLPGAGGTQRLPRVAGVRKALEMCATGNPIGAKEAFDCGLVDRLIEGELIPHAVGYAEEVRDVRPLPKIVASAQDKVDDVDPAVFDEFRKENAQEFRGFDAPDAEHRGGRGRDREALCRRRDRRAQAVHGADERHPGRARSNISSSPSARRPRSRACPRTPSRAPIQQASA